MSETKLLPCPFCAAEPTEYAGGSQGFPVTFGVVCTMCGAAVEDSVGGQHIRKWNDRAVNPDSAALGQARHEIEDYKSACDTPELVYTRNKELLQRVAELEKQLDEDVQLSVSRYKRIQELEAELKAANSREREAFTAAWRIRAKLADIDNEDTDQAWQQHRCQDDTDWKSVPAGDSET